MKNRMKKEIREFKLLIRSVPASLVSLFVVSLVTMNLLANKSVELPFDWLALDCGITVSWISFLSMDVITKHFGPKAATEISVFAVSINLLSCLFFFISSRIPGVWGASFVDSGAEAINAALDSTFGGAWYVLAGSTAAFIAAAFVNNFLNYAIGMLFRKNPDGFAAYACRTYLSTAAGQFADNLIFALLVSHFFFGWSLTQCFTCALSGMAAELLCEIIFSRIGYRLTLGWKRSGVGAEYFESIGRTFI